MTEIVLGHYAPTTKDWELPEQPVDPPSEDVEISIAGIVEMLLKNERRLNALLRDESYQRELVPRMMAVALVGFAIYGVVTTAIFNALWIERGVWLPFLPSAHWNDLSVANLTLAYSLGVIAANGICLPSFYFYGLLAGVKISMLGVTAHAVKGMAAGAVALVGLLPIYVAFALTPVVFPLGEPWPSVCVASGLVLPFVAGVFGAANLYQGFVGLADTMRCGDRAARYCFLRRLILAWVGCASFVTPVVIFTLWDFLGDVTRNVSQLI